MRNLSRHLAGSCFQAGSTGLAAAPLGIGGTIIQVIRQDPRAVADDHLVAQHDRMKGQQPLRRSGGRTDDHRTARA